MPVPPPGPSDPVAETRELQKRYAGDGSPVRALRGVDLSVDRGEFLSIVGPSGSGKSTLLNLLAGLERPSGGEVLIAGQPIAQLSEQALARMRRRDIGIVFQFFNLLVGMTALENVLLPALIAGLSVRNATERARSLLDLLGLYEHAESLPGVLSGGERQRLAVARALANRPTLLLADEPTGALDSTGTAELLELFRRLHADGQTIVLVTHDTTVARAASRTVTLRDGLLET